MASPIAGAVEAPLSSAVAMTGEKIERGYGSLVEEKGVAIEEPVDVVSHNLSAAPQFDEEEDAASVVPLAAVFGGALSGGYSLLKYNIAKDAYARYLATRDDQEAIMIWDDEVVPNQRQAIIAGSASAALIGVVIAMTVKNTAPVSVTALSNGVFVSGTW